MFFVLCFTFYVLCFMFYFLWFLFYVSCFMKACTYVSIFCACTLKVRMTLKDHQEPILKVWWWSDIIWLRYEDFNKRWHTHTCTHKQTNKQSNYCQICIGIYYTTQCIWLILIITQPKLDVGCAQYSTSEYSSS